MSKIPVIYWSGTGNTEKMANHIEEGIVAAGGEADVKEVSSVKAEDLKDVPVYALGCPSMGDEVLEEEEMEPFVTELEQYVQGKKIGLFGSYGWGNCEWMRDWEERMKKAGADIVSDEGVAIMEEPDDDAIAQCKALGEKLAAK